MSTIDKAMAKLTGKSDSPDDNTEVKDTQNAEPSSEPRKPVLLQEEVSESPSGAEASSTEEQSQKPSPRPVEQRKQHRTAKAEDSGRQSQFSEIDINSLTQRGFVTQQTDNRLVKEQFRAIKRKLLNNAFGAISKTLNNPNLIIVSSCNPHEGKTFSAINLALNIALEQDKTVLLVDADVVRPSVVKELGVPPVDGLTEYLLGKIDDVSDIIHSTNIDNFKFIPAGQPHELSTELLASEKMANLAEELATRYSDRVVIFDAPPLLGVNETHVMANLVGQAVVVVEENKTKLADVQLAVEQLEKRLAIGFLMNKSNRGSADQYGYGYGYYKQDG